MSGWDVTVLHVTNGKGGLVFQFLDGLHFSRNIPLPVVHGYSCLVMTSSPTIISTSHQDSCDDTGAKRCWDYWEVQMYWKKMSWVFVVHQHGKKETSWENVEISVKNLGLKCDQGSLGLGGKLQKNQWKMRKVKVPTIHTQFCCTWKLFI